MEYSSVCFKTDHLIHNPHLIYHSMLSYFVVVVLVIIRNLYIYSLVILFLYSIYNSFYQVNVT